MTPWMTPPTPPDPDEEPDRAPEPDLPQVPGFEPLRRLGVGSHSQVWLATDLTRSELVALKLPVRHPPDSPAAGRGVGASTVEVGVLRRIDHPNVVRLHQVAEQVGGGAVLVLEYAPGGSLADLLAIRGRLGPGEVTSLVMPLARAMAHLHSLGVVHADLSPGNVLFAADGRPLLADLGVAALLGLGGEPWGTDGFADPQQIGPADRATDIRALGALGWFALTGTPVPAALSGLDPSPGRAEPAVQRVADLLRQQLPGSGGAPPTIDPDPLIQLLARCLQPDRAARPTAVDLVKQAWSAARPVPIRMVGWLRHSTGAELPDGHESGGGQGAGPAPTSAVEMTRRLRAAVTGPAPAPVRAARWRPAARVLVLVGLLVAALLAGGAGWWWAGGSGSRMTPVAAAGPTAARPAAGAHGGQVTVDWARVVRELATRRAAALEAASPSALRGVDEPGSSAMTADLRLLDRLDSQRTGLAGLRFTVDGVRLITMRREGSSMLATVEAAVQSSAHRRIELGGRSGVGTGSGAGTAQGAGGRAVAVPPGPRQRVRLLLVAPFEAVTGKTGGHREVAVAWRVREVLSVR